MSSLRDYFLSAIAFYSVTCAKTPYETPCCAKTQGRFYVVEVRGLEPNIRPVSLQQSIPMVGPTQL